MRINYFILSVIIFTLISMASCISPPSFHSEEITPNDILFNLKCEVAHAVSKKNSPHSWLENYRAGILLNLKVINSNASTGSANLKIPLTPGFATPKLIAGLTTQASRTITIKTKFDIASILNIQNCADNSNSRLLEGDLGINEYLNRMRYINDDQSHTVEDFAYKLDFEITKSLTPSSAWSLIPVNNDIFGASISAALTAKNAHTLTFTITPLAPGAITSFKANTQKQLRTISNNIDFRKKTLAKKRSKVNLLNQSLVSKNLIAVDKGKVKQQIEQAKKEALAEEKKLRILKNKRNRLSKSLSKNRLADNQADIRLNNAEFRNILEEIRDNQDSLR